MEFWSTDLTTEDGALGATGIASWACFVIAGLGLIGAAFLFGMPRVGNPVMWPALSFMAAELLLFLVAGFRFRAGRGFGWGIAAAAVLVLEIIFKLISLTGWIGLIFNAVCLVVIINGVRGTAALKRGFPDYDEQAEIFG